MRGKTYFGLYEVYSPSWRGREVMGDTQGKHQVQPVKAGKVEGGRDSVEVEAWDSRFFRATGMGK